MNNTCQFIIIVGSGLGWAAFSSYCKLALLCTKSLKAWTPRITKCSWEFEGIDFHVFLFSLSSRHHRHHWEFRNLKSTLSAGPTVDKINVLYRFAGNAFHTYLPWPISSRIPTSKRILRRGNSRRQATWNYSHCVRDSWCGTKERFATYY